MWTDSVPFPDAVTCAPPSIGNEMPPDPLRHPPFGKVPRGYYRLPGPAGYKSRYEDPALDAVADVIRNTQSAETFVLFANVDMYADSKRLRKLIER